MKAKLLAASTALALLIGCDNPNPVDEQESTPDITYDQDQWDDNSDRDNDRPGNKDEGAEPDQQETDDGVPNNRSEDGSKQDPELDRLQKELKRLLQEKDQEIAAAQEEGDESRVRELKKEKEKLREEYREKVEELEKKEQSDSV